MESATRQRSGSGSASGLHAVTACHLDEAVRRDSASHLPVCTDHCAPRESVRNEVAMASTVPTGSSGGGVRNSIVSTASLFAEGRMLR